MTSIRTCEFTCVGHPDKLCDLIADTILDDLLFEDPSARCAVEVMATKGRIIVAGEITSSVKVSIRAAVRRALTRRAIRRSAGASACMSTARARISCPDSSASFSSPATKSKSPCNSRVLGSFQARHRYSGGGHFCCENPTAKH